MDKEVAKLWLYENTITTTPGPLGYKNTAQTRYTWNVNLIDVLGETLYNNFDYYIVELVDLARINASPYIYIDGLNLIQTSKNGQPQGGSALVGGLSMPYGDQSTDLFWDANGSNYKYIMIKPNTNKIELSIYWEPMTGVNGTSTYGSWFFTFQGLQKANPLYSNPFNSFHNLEQKTFTLTTQALVAGTTNQFGTLNANYTEWTLFNINFRNILGTMWDKYEKFNLIMTSWAAGTTLGGSFSGDQRYNYLIMEGLQFINTLAVGPANTISYNKFGIGGAGFIESSGGASSTSIYSGFHNMSTANTFRKPESENVNLTFRVGNTTTFPSGNIYANWSVNFMVIGIK
jgi:hypothetical protein